MKAEPTPTSSARALVDRARGRLFRHGLARASLRGLAVAALLAAAAAAAARILGHAPGPWLLLALVPGAAAALPAVLGARPGLRHAALRLDRAAGTRERFLTSIEVADPDVAELVARQALESPEVRRGFPLRVPPSAEGLVAALSLGLLAVVLLIVSGGPDATVAGDPPPVGSDPVTGVVTGPGGDDEPSGKEPDDPRTGASPYPATPDPVARLASGEDLDEEAWRALEAAGVPEAVRAAVQAALEDGDAAKAAALLGKALDGRAVVPGGDGGTAAAAWTDYRRALESPGWRRVHDRVVREYFRRAAEEGLR